MRCTRAASPELRLLRCPGFRQCPSRPPQCRQGVSLAGMLSDHEPPPLPGFAIDCQRGCQRAVVEPGFFGVAANLRCARGCGHHFDRSSARCLRRAVAVALELPCCVLHGSSAPDPYPTRGCLVPHPRCLFVSVSACCPVVVSVCVRVWKVNGCHRCGKKAWCPPLGSVSLHHGTRYDRLRPGGPGGSVSPSHPHECVCMCRVADAIL